jgi:hypothetical protein
MYWKDIKLKIKDKRKKDKREKESPPKAQDAEITFSIEFLMKSINHKVSQRKNKEH